MARVRAAREHGEVRDAVTAYPFTSHAAVRSGVARVTLAGELDLDSGPAVQEAVSACLEEEVTSLWLDLTDVSFCDCAGLGALFRARTAVLRAGADLVVEGVGSQLGRLLRLVGAEDLFTGRSANPESAHRASGTASTRRDVRAEATAEWPLRRLA
ncbi:STAS domain-containing protein [Streptomyces sp. NPDC096323]|uniref:STAS domain-containing protein n=1 Tax=Streptomyces sp. NPDC096323 TaxID=3155822 RepID=UPI00331CD158